jgi:hypothetical protein
MANNNHVSEADLEKLHKQGACLTRHQKRAKGNKCSHQWQAKEQAEAHPSVYNYPSYYTLCDNIPGGIFLTALRSNFPPGYGEEWLGSYWKNKPTHSGKEWDLGKDDNFNHFAKPYWHNAHHIVPNRALASAINDAASQAKNAELINLIKAGLLKAEYNLNDKINMVILPMERIVAAALALPRHLKRDEVGPDEKKEFRSHADYSKRIENKLVGVMRNYKETLAKALDSDHQGPPDDISKEQLEELSESTYDAIIKAGGYIGGKALSQLKF